MAIIVLDLGLALRLQLFSAIISSAHVITITYYYYYYYYYYIDNEEIERSCDICQSASSTTLAGPGNVCVDLKYDVLCLEVFVQCIPA